MPGCPDPALLEGLFQGVIGSEQRAAIEQHLDQCRDCSATVAALARLFGSASWGPGPGHGTRGGSMDATWPGTRAASGEPSPADLGRYALGRRLGAGGMGVVFEAEDRELHRRVALKLLYTGPSAELEQTRDRLLREARAMAQTNHPNVVAVYDVGRLGEQVFLAMELVEGMTLTAWLRAGRSRAELLAAFVMAGRGLAAAHATGLVHRDFKPDNVLIGRDGRARVTDFGLALLGDAPEPGRIADLSASTQIQTEHGAIVGTPAYMAPEQWCGQPADARSDQFSFCVALYEALVGVRPFAGDDLHSLANAVLFGSPRPLGRELPGWLRATVMRGLARAPEARFPSMTALLAELERDRSGPRRAAIAAVGMGLVAAVVGGGLAWATRGSQAQRVPSEAATASAVADEPDRAEACASSQAAAQGRWTPARRATLVAHVEDMDDGQPLAERLLPILDAWAERWTGLATQNCAASSDALAAAERGCLDAALARFNALIQEAGALRGFEVAGALVPGALRLPELDRCASGSPWLSLSPPPPAAEVAGKVALVRRDLARVEASVDLEQWVAVRQGAEALVTSAEALGYAPLLAEAQLARGELDRRVGETDSAIPWFEAAVETATVAEHERVVGLAALALAELRADQLRLGDARRWSSVAGALAERLDDPGLRGLVRLADARALAAVAEHRDALDALDEAGPLLRERYGEGDPRVIELELARVDAYLATAQLDEAATAAARAHSRALAALGGEALLTGRATAARARVALARGQLDEAETLARAASQIPGVGRSRRHDLDRGRALGLLGDVALARGEPSIARGHYVDAQTYLYAGPESALPLLWQGIAELRGGQREQGLALITAAWTRLDEHWPADDLRRLALLRIIGLAALDSGAIAEARVALERAVELADAELGFGPQLARAEADLGYLERAVGRPEAALRRLDSAYVGLVAGFGQRHPEVVASSLARADLAWELGDLDYAERLYGGVYRNLEAERGAADPATQRAAARRSSPPE